ncbi:MAG: hypothetical protein D6790_18065 [Caldilineae bacterium]|nr:MAG: hypothetical protein D6790_18065 [Caldilineae bacterium]
MYMVMLVLNDPDLLDDVLDAWHEAGVRGATVLESTGIYRRRPQLISARYAFGFSHLVQAAGQGHYTLFTIVADEEMVDRCLAATQEVTGDLREPHTGVMAAWPLSHTRGARSQFGPTDEDDASDHAPTPSEHQP